MSKLQDQLDQITANTRNLVQPERLEISERAVAELYAAGVEDRILQVGSQAPEFALPDAAGRIVRSADLLALGPLVINFFRGRWCPYCVTELEILAGSLQRRPQARRAADRDLPANCAPERLHCGAAWASLSRSDRCRMPVGCPVRPGLRGRAFPAAVLPQHPGKYPPGEWGRELAAASAGNLHCRAEMARSFSPAPMPISAFAPNRGKCWIYSRRKTTLWCAESIPIPNFG